MSAYTVNDSKNEMANFETGKELCSSKAQMLSSKWETRTCTSVMYTGELSVVQTESKLDSSAGIIDELN